MRFTQPVNANAIQNRQDFLEHLYTKYSDTGGGYRSLNRTLPILPKCAPVLLPNLKLVHLTRPMLDVLELHVLLAAAGICKSAGLRLHPIFHTAKRDEIIKAMLRMSFFLYRIEPVDYMHKEAKRGQLSPQRINDIGYFSRFLSLYGEPHEGNIIGFTEKALKNFAVLSKKKRQQAIQEYGADCKLQPPIIPLPTAPGITFIDTVGQLVQEGERLQNCVVSYVDAAIKGELYFFHVEKDGAQATAMIDNGHLLIADGKGHQENAATRWAFRKLGMWGVKLSICYLFRKHQPERND